ncbi:hypothetical protein AB5I39_10930 [Sphingomonas sp. MMS24-J45]|uniref:hypothetical protein n=1 Tax=Sphingomonas sp. MMS24-J45 TaxID=3238806 RepID=UPI003850D139
MTSERCSLCNKSAERAALVRCSDARCPLAKPPQRVSVKTLVAMGVAALVAIAAVAGISMMTVEDSADGNTLAVEDATDAPGTTPTPRNPLHAAVQTGDRSAFAWLAELFDAPKAAPQEVVATEMLNPGTPDPRAASRVQSFPCEGALTPSRSLMCTRWDLATADYNLSLQYKNALVHSRNPRALRKARAVWLQQLDALGGDAVRIQKHIDSFQRTIATS